jgi:CheY-like chemotaxis protein
MQQDASVVSHLMGLHREICSPFFLPPFNTASQILARYWTKVQYRTQSQSFKMMPMGNKSTWIAVVDHDAQTRQAMVCLLRSLGFDAMSFSSGNLFIQSLRLKQPTCILLDLHMPYMSGFAVMSKLEQFGEKIPVIVLTKHELMDDFKKTCLSSAVAVLQKPVDEQELRTVIEKALNQGTAGFPGPQFLM